jgi:hypothetical protein
MINKIIFLNATIFSLSLSAAEADLKATTEKALGSTKEDYATFCAAQIIGKFTFACIKEHNTDVEVEDMRQPPLASAPRLSIRSAVATSPDLTATTNVF